MRQFISSSVIDSSVVYTLTLFIGRSPNASHSSRVVFKGSNVSSIPKCACEKSE